jgi:hypothetical protein
MATDHVYLSGKGKWIRVGAPNQYGDYTCVLYPDAPSLVKINKLKEEGIKNELKKDEDGYFMRFKSPQSKLIRGKVVGFAPPIVLEKDGKTLLQGVVVGNGSDITIKIEVYDYQGVNKVPGKATRLKSIRVDNLVPFEMSRDFEEDQEKAVRGLPEQPEPLF